MIAVIALKTKKVETFQIVLCLQLMEAYWFNWNDDGIGSASF